MAKYTVQSGHIKHGRKGEKTAKTYAPGEDIELTEEEAQSIGANVKPAGKEPKKLDEKKTIEVIEHAANEDEVYRIVQDDERPSVLKAAEEKIKSLKKGK
ncbi:MAG TPA: hypothetical protein ENH31_00370 [Nitrospirae bacterium]|nr:hypothetical protein [Nitrospirota bacterium]HDK41676.1 hypothetical protein [Nitrospirota bacterium]HDK81006.1 hypothetical protein [Nitrospirota bacterium]